MPNTSRCNAILAGGVFDTLIVKEGSSANEQMYEFLKLATWETFKKHQDAGIKFTLPFEIPIEGDGSYTEKSFRQFVQLREQGQFIAITAENFRETVKKTVNPKIADDWRRCVEAELRAFGLKMWVDTDDRKENGFVTIKAMYTSDGATPQPTVSSFTVANAAVYRDNPFVKGAVVQAGGVPVLLKREGKRAITVSLLTNERGGVSLEVPALETGRAQPRCHIKLFSNRSSPPVNFPNVTVNLPQDYKLIGGGALVNWHGVGNLLVESYPVNNTWFARGKDHQHADPSEITAWAIGLYDPEDEWEVVVHQNTVNAVPYKVATAQAQLPLGYVMTSGGFKAEPLHPGRLVTASYPVNNRTWEATCKDHRDETAGSITTYVIGIRAQDGLNPDMTIKTASSAVAAHPTAEIRFDQGYVVTGGGGLTNCPLGNLLTASYPRDSSTWCVESKDHMDPCPSTLNAFGVGLRLGPGSMFEGLGVNLSPITAFPGALGIAAGSVPAYRHENNDFQLGNRRQYICLPNDSVASIALRFYNSDSEDVCKKILDANVGIITDATRLDENVLINLP